MFFFVEKHVLMTINFLWVDPVWLDDSQCVSFQSLKITTSEKKPFHGNMVEDGGHLSSSSGPAPAQAWSVRANCPRLVWLSFEYLHRQRLHSLCGHRVPVFDHLHSEKRSFWSLNRISCISLCARCLLLCHWPPLRRVWLCILYSPPQVFIHTDKMPLSLLFFPLSSWLW